ncbi:MBL fold metallo-hydrolase [uncultured Rummeliibacillus sp.]|uniref:MBL fold metallo-hydrolase n=1 Tax=uncultured Rummeliibacillus sp. TaxID=762292 RepID=UPI002624D53C|nr:MBL fold metallo-hydrolase [uncultured Rummeliibacillus sp.]
MNYYICETCGVQHDLSSTEPKECKICTEERQYVSLNGQSWTTLEQLVQFKKYTNEFTSELEGLHSIKTTPSFGIGQNSYLIQNKDFNVLWDCITYIDEETISMVRELGGIQAIALSHPHYYSTQVEWAEAFNAPIYIHEDDKEWVTRPSKRIIFWTGDTLKLHDGIVLHRIGGHFKGATILEWNSSTDSVLLVGDIVRVVADRQWVTFMYSYPNFIPLPANTVKRMAQQLNSIQFNKLFDAFHRVISTDAQTRVQLSAKRYIAALEGELFET